MLNDTENYLKYILKEKNNSTLTSNKLYSKIETH